MDRKQPLLQNAACSDCSGFTLVELLFTIGLLMVLIAVLTPSLADLTRQNQIQTISAKFSQALQLTRNEAIKRNTKMALCKSNSGTQCDNSLNWEDGFILFNDLNGDGKVNRSETVFRVYEKLPAGITLRGNSNIKNRITYKPTGDSTSMGRFVICASGELQNSEVIFINGTGRIRTGKDADGNGIPEEDNGDEIDSCTP